MSNQVNFSTHSSQIHSAHERILAADPEISWAVFGFDKGSNDLKVDATGSEGLEELVEEFDSGKVQYAFYRFSDPKTKLNKFVFFSWCGSGVPVFKKGLLGSQIGDVQNVLKGYHVSINARSDDDILPESIMEKIEESSGSRYDNQYSKKIISPKPLMSTSNIPPQPKIATKPTGYSNKYSSPKNIPSKPNLDSYSSRSYNFPARKTLSPDLTTPKITDSSISNIPREKKSEPTQASLGTKPLFTNAKPVSSIFGPKKFSSQNFSSSSNTSKPIQSAKINSNSNLYGNSNSPSNYNPSTGANRISTASEKHRLNATDTVVASNLSQADQTKSELEMLRNKNLNNRKPSNSGTSFNYQNREPNAINPIPSDIDKLSKDLTKSTTITNQRKYSLSSPFNQSVNNDNSSKTTYHSKSQSVEYNNSQLNKNVETKIISSKQAVVMYTYQAEESNEMDLYEGEIITDIEVIDDGWWSGKSLNSDRSGLFPANFVEFIETDNVGSVSSDPSGVPTSHDILQEQSQSSPKSAQPNSSLSSPPPPPPPPAPQLNTFSPPLPPPPAPAPAPQLNTFSPPPPPPAPQLNTFSPPLPPLPPKTTSLHETAYGNNIDSSVHDLPPALPSRRVAEIPSVSDESEAPPPLPRRQDNDGNHVNSNFSNVNSSNTNSAIHQDTVDDFSTSYKAVALYDYSALEDGELSFDEGELITNVDFPSDEWWQGFNSKGQFGLFPANYVELSKN
ncbi:Drebrin-like protein B [Smittium culicis]|uniref:Drebrin-like protein B n=1 Tax=Smittium culicis TaxID=133412 RepID=A0A1R1YGQ4_9FUNG|nr:Drebrin-like protein B [Smittium culicis]